MSHNKVKVPSENWQAIDQLEPQSLWTQFAILSSIPRPSKQEGAVLDYIKGFADEHGLTWKQDNVGNLVVFHPGSGGGQQAPPVVVQGHVDMVTEKNSDSSHNFAEDPILLRRFHKNEKEVWLGARGTTLGADNGIGVSAALALLETPVDSNIPLPPLEALFTVDEETGLTGAQQLDAKALGLTGTTLLNLDTEEWAELYVGCAGGGESVLTLPLSRKSNADADGSSANMVQLRVEGLLGGHSGINIHEGRANAVVLCAAVTQAALKHEGVDLVSIKGGDKHNAIPREAFAQLLISHDKSKQAVMNIVKKYEAALKAEYGTLEQKLSVTLVGKDDANDEDLPCQPLDDAAASRLLSMLLALPHGAIKFSHVMPSLVETSNNVASVATNNDCATVLCSTRSSIQSALEATRDRLTAVACLAGASIEKSEPYPGWNPDMNSPVLQLAKKLLSERLDGDCAPGVKAIHAGLECGLLIEKMGGKVDALSFGPTITGAHSPDESIHADTVPPFFQLVRDILAELAKKR